MRHKLYVVGLGPGERKFLTPAVEEVMESAACLIIARRHLSLAKAHPDVVLMANLDATLAVIEERLQKGSVAVAVSGDTGVFSYLRRLKERFSKEAIEVIPGISALQFLCAAVGETWENAVILSLHGRDVAPSKITGTAACNGKSIFFCGPDRDPSWLCRILSSSGLDSLDIVIGERMSYPDERVVRGSPSELCVQEFDPLSVVLVLNADPLPLLGLRPRDADFLRAEGIPMTREEVRTLVLDKMELRPDSVVWDIGAGTGSIAVSCALAAPYGEVHAVERLPRACELIEANKVRFRLPNLHVHRGDAAELLDALPAPACVFIGGSGGRLRMMLEYVRKWEKVRIVVSGVTLETVCDASAVMNGSGFHDFDVLQLAVARGKNVGSSTIMAAQNPVTLLCARTGEEKIS